MQTSVTCACSRPVRVSLMHAKRDLRPGFIATILKGLRGSQSREVC